MLVEQAKKCVVSIELKKKIAQVDSLAYAVLELRKKLIFSIAARESLLDRAAHVAGLSHKLHEISRREINVMDSAEVDKALISYGKECVELRKFLRKERICFYCKILSFVPAYLLIVAIVSHFIFSHYVGFFTFMFNLVHNCC